MQFSKSKYTTAIQCPKALWLQTYRPRVLDIADTAAQTRLENGKIVGNLACKIFTPGEHVPYHDHHQIMIDKTRQLVEKRIEYIYEATFSFQGIIIMIDILRNTPEGVEIFEVKSSTDTKDIYYDDVAIQKYVLQNLGYFVINTSLVYLNNKYTRGDSLDIHALFTIENINEPVEERQENIPLQLDKIHTYMQNPTEEPDIEIGRHCKHPYTCSAKTYCWKKQREIPEYSMFNIFNLGSKKQKELYAQGIVDIDDVPNTYPMTDLQFTKVSHYKNNTTYIDKEAIKDFLGTLTFPIYHLDFETFQQPIPQWEGISPYQQIPFQYSLHIQYENGDVEHKEFLAKEGIDPREALVKRLIADIPADVTVLAYNMSFEKGVIKKLADRFEEFSTHLLQINENMCDLMIPFKKLHYVTPSMQGSHSIKYILPALIPHMETAYKELQGVQNGSEAMNAYATLSALNSDEISIVRKGLKAYCKLDTLSMVEILNHLYNITTTNQRA